MRSWNTYDSNARLEISAHGKETMEEVATDTNKVNDKNSVRFSPYIIEETIKANLELLHAQISALTEIMDRLIQGNAARAFKTASTRELRPRPESPFAEAPVTSRFSPVAPLTTAGYSPDYQNGTGKNVRAGKRQNRELRIK